MLDLRYIYNNLPLPQKQNLNSYSAKGIKGFEKHRIGKNYLDNPSLLIFISEKDKDFLIPNQNLFNLKIAHNLQCEIELENKFTSNNFSVISYTGQDSDVKDLFLSTCEILIKSLGQNPTNSKVKFVVGKFIDLFKSLQEVPRKSLQGLWAELFVIEQSIYPEILITGWHSIPEEKFDFSFGKLRIEVKSCSSEIRTHHFSSGQLNPIDNTEIIIASLITNINAGGVSLDEIMRKIIKKLNDFPKQIEKLHLLVYSILGTDVGRINEVKFDYQLAKESFLLYDSSSIPKIQVNDIPEEVSNVKFISNLMKTKSLNLTIDELIKPYTK